MDVRDFAEGFIDGALLGKVDSGVPVFLGGKPSKADPNYYISILTEEENEVSPGSNIWILQNSITLVCNLKDRSSDQHNKYRQQIRRALIELTGIKNYSVENQGRWYGAFITSVDKANRGRSYGDIFYLETRARSFGS